jgi:capsular exopolysaccharide synthesis family protein
VAANLAAALAQVGRRVLLVDADMRNPTQHHVWNLTNGIGLSNGIVEQVAVAEAAQTVMPNLSVLTAGVVPPNPLSLLDSRRMEELVSQWSTQFDLVIFDTPPLVGNADAAVLGKLVDGTVLVVRPGVVDLESARSAREFLTRSHQNVLGMVANGVQIKDEPDSYFYVRQLPETETPELTPTQSLAANPKSKSFK